jgi:hypothetical protein
LGIIPQFFGNSKRQQNRIIHDHSIRGIAVVRDIIDYHKSVKQRKGTIRREAPLNALNEVLK